MNRGSRALCAWLAVLLALCAGPVQAQQAVGTITGRVTDGRTGQPIANTEVTIDGTSISQVVDREGRYRISNVPAGNRTVSVRMIGYGTASKAVTVVAGEVAVVDLQLTVRPIDMEAIVVTGQGGAMARRRIATTVDVISRETIEAAPVARLDQLLQTKLPGAQIRMTSGQAGTTSLIRTRGINSVSTNSTPVIYVDGVRVDNLNTGATLGLNISGGRSSGAATSAIADLPLENIERVEHIPGGAATTLYGSDAANGVIQIFTRQGAAGATRAWFETRLGYDTPMTDFHYFDRTSELLYRNGLNQQYLAGVEGGNGLFTYSLSANVRSSESHRVYGDNTALGFRTGMGAGIGSSGRYTGSLSFNQADMPRFRNGNSGGYQSLWFLEGGRSNAFGFNPNLDEMTDEEFAALKTFVNDAERLQNYRVFVRRFQTSHGVTVEATPSITLRGTFGLDNRFSRERAITTNEFLVATRSFPAGTTDRGSLQTNDRNFVGYTMDLGAQHKKEFRNVSVISSLGAQLFRTDDEQSQLAATNVRDGAETVNGAGTTTSADFTARVANWGLFGQTNIGLMDRYFIELGLRADKNTAFGQDIGTQLYPKVGLVYAIASEPWVRSRVSEDILSDLRVRGAYGVAGNFPRPFANDRTVSFNSYLGQQAATFGQQGNPELGPERTYTTEIGTDASFVNNRATFGLTWYHAITRDALFNAPSPPSLGEGSQLRNVGEIKNTGIEFRATVVPISRQGLRLTLSGSLNTLENIVLDAGGSPPFALSGLSANTIQGVVAEGMPVGFLRGRKAIFGPDGRIVETIPLQYLGKPHPDKFGNMSATLAIRNNLTLSADGDYQFGASAHSFDRHFRFLYGIKGTENDLPTAALEQYNNVRSAIWLECFNCFIEDTDYVKLRSLTVEYRLPERFIPRPFLNARLGLSATNVVGWAKSTFDPEVDLSGAATQGAAAVGGFNYSTDSAAKSYMLTLRLGF
ncbi:MAG TPA: TonB-dependent receptor [Longimicrobiales bacterium]|nr:TonB-dependent receptor [Longimicrobiales bacterium]